MKTKFYLFRVILAFVLCLLGLATAHAQSCGCTYTVPTTAKVVDNDVLNLPPGSTICLQGTYTNSDKTTLLFKNFRTDDPANRFVFKNCGGQAKIISGNTTQGNGGLDFVNCKNFHVTGTGDPTITYGILIEGRLIGSVYAPEWGVRIGGKSTDVEMDHVRVQDVQFAGFGIKTDPSCSDTTAWREYFTMRNVQIHHNLVDHTNTGEGFYIGYTGYSAVISCEWKDSNGVVIKTKSGQGHTIQGLRVYENQTYNTGSEGIQVGSSNQDVEIHDNYIEEYGQRPLNGDNDGQGNGMQIGDGTTGLCYNNFIKGTAGTKGSAMKVFGINNVLFNNILVDSHGAAIFIDERQGTPTGPGSGFKLYNNVIVNPVNGSNIVLYTENVEQNWVKNNILVRSASAPGTFIQLLSSSVSIDSTNNFRTTNIANVKFNSDYSLMSGSPCIDNGVNLYSEGVTIDFVEQPRPSSGPFEQGAYEFGTSPDPDPGAWALYINAGGDTYNELENGQTIEWESDLGCATCTPHPSLDQSFQTYATGSTAAFGGANSTTAPSQVLGTYRYTLNEGTTIRYNIPVPQSGTYDVELFFARKNADTFVSGERRFNIFVEGLNVVTYDVYDAGGIDGTAASSFPYTAQVTDGMLEVKFVAVAGAHSMINAIAVKLQQEPAPDQLSLFINSGGDEYVDGTTTWESDLGCATCTPHPTLDQSFQTYATGSTAAFSGANSTTAPSQVLGTYRYTLNSGTTIRYNIPVPAAGTYDVELYFARKNADTFVSGERRFNILIEGLNVATYDVYDAGGTNGTAASSFAYSADVTDGMLEIKFVAVAGAHSMINAIHVQGPGSAAAMQPQTMLMASSPEESVAMYPNPTTNQVKIDFESDDVYRVKVLTAQNELYLSSVIEGKKGDSQTIDVSGIGENEMFIVIIQSSKGVKTYRLFKTMD